MSSPQISRRLALLAGALTASAWARGQTAPLQPVVLGQVSLSFYAVTGAVVQELLERLGHPVELRTGAHDEMFPLLGQGGIDLMAAAWLPQGHAAYWSRYGAEALEVAQLYGGAHFFWAVPDYVPASAVSAIEDLATPEVARRMARRIQSIGVAAAITTVSQNALRAYGLDTVGYELRPGSAADWTGAFETAFAARQWFVFPTWAPHYLNRGGRLRPIRDTKGVLGGTNHAALVAPAARWQQLPAATQRALARVRLSLDDVTEMDWSVNVDKLSAREAARSWIRANAARFDAWTRG